MEDFVIKYIALDKVPTHLPMEWVSSESLQVSLLNSTMRHPTMERFPLPNLHREKLLNAILRTCEAENIPIADDVYEELANCFKSSHACRNSFGIFRVPGKDIVFNAPIDPSALVQGGSTGFKTWEAGRCLAWYMSTQIAKGELDQVLEIGCGTGATGIVTVHSRGTIGKYIFTDCHPETLERAHCNWVLNLDSITSSRNVTFELLDILKPGPRQITAQVMVGADILYDEELCSGLIRFLESTAQFKQVLIATTIRTDEVYQRFRDNLSKSQNLISSVLVSKRLTEWHTLPAEEKWRRFIGCATLGFDPVIELIKIEKP